MTPINLARDLKSTSLFADLPEDLLVQIAGQLKERTLPPGEILFREGDEDGTFYFVKSGEVEIFQQKDEQVLEVLEAGEYFSEMALLETKPRSASARTRTEVTLLSLGRAPFQQLLEQNSSLGLKMSSIISARLKTSVATSAEENSQKTTGAKTGSTKVFISYSRRDKEFVTKLNKAVSSYEMDTWVDWENIPLTADWWNEIRLGIENADAFAFVISPDSLSSEVCGREIQTAVDNHKRLIPILHREPEKGNPMHEKVSSHNWIYMRDDTELAANVPQMLAVINTDLAFVKAHTRLLERAFGWEREKKNDSFALQGDELHQAERWLESAGSKQPQPTPLHIEFIQASRRAATKRQRTIMTASLVGLGISIVLAVLSFLSFLQAREAKADAEVQRDNAKAAEIYANQQANLAATAQHDAEISRDNALVAEATALAAQAEAEHQASIAATEEAKAIAAQAEAEAQKAIAEEQAKLAKAGDLAASGRTLLETNPPLAVLLALESDRLSPNNVNAQNVLSQIPIYFPPLRETFINAAQTTSVLAWSPSGQLVSSSGSDIILWNLDTHEPEQILFGHFVSTTVTAMAWNANGRLATGSDNGTIILWDLDTGEPDRTLPPLQPLGITSLAWSPSGRLASSSADGTIVIQDLSGQAETIFLESDFPVNAVAYSAYGALASAGENGVVSIWDVRQGRVQVNYANHQAGVLTLAWAPNGSLASGARDSTVAVRNPSGNLQAILRGHTDYVNVVAWSDDNRLASASWDKTVILWDLEKETPQRVFRGHTAPIFALDWGPEGKLTSGADYIFIWDTIAEYALTSYSGHLDWTYATRWTPDGQLVSYGGDGKVIIWDHAAQTVAETIPISSQTYERHIAVSGNQFLMMDGVLRDRQTDQEYFLQGYQHTFSPDGNFIAGLGDWQGYELGIWALAPLLETRQVVSQTFALEGDTWIQALAWSPDGKSIATGQGDGTLILWDFDAATASVTLRESYPAHAGAVTALAWSADNRLASAGDDWAIQIWNPQTLANEHTLTGIHEAAVLMLSWSPQGELASISGDTQIVIWDVTLGTKKAVLGAPYDGTITSIAWSTDGTRLAFGGSSYNVYVYNTLYIQAPCTWLTRNMTYQEWRAYLPDIPYQPTCAELPVGTAFEDEKAALASSFLEGAFQAIYQGDIALGVDQFEEAESQGIEIDAWSWNNLCWFGALYNQADISAFACDRALELAPENDDFRDSRGIARALLGDFEGAIEDFEAFLAVARELGYPEEMLDQRQEWIEALRAGINPFNEALLATLRGE